MKENNASQKNHYGFWTLTFLVVANMIGAAVFTTSGFSMGGLHSPSLVIFAWIVAGLIAICGAVSYGVLIRKLPESGGEYMFLTRAWHPMLGFVAGWVSMFAGFTAAIAFAATSFEQYALTEELKKSLHVPTDLVAILVVVLAGLFHGIRIAPGKVIQNVAVLLKLSLLVAFLLFAAFKLPSMVTVNDMEPVEDPLSQFCQALMWLSLSYMGFNAAVYVAEEAGDAKRVIPRSLIAGTVIVTLLYVLLNAVFVYSANASEVAASRENVAALSAQRLGGDTFENLFRLVISIAMFTGVTSMMMAAPRVYAKMADDGMLPSFFGFQNETPKFAMVFQTVLAILIILNSTLEGLLKYLGVTLSLCAVASVSGLYRLKYREPRSIANWELILPTLYIAATIFAITMTCIYQSIWQLYAALGTFAVGIVGYSISGIWRKREAEKDTSSAG